MKSNYRKLGEFINEVDVRNESGKEENLFGVSIQKEFIPSIANTVGTDFSNYKIVKKGQFAYGPVTSRNGDKISIALLNEPECIVSSSYTVFEIIKPEELLPEYLMLWFRRKEFDRYARYMSIGSVREMFDWDEMCKVELPVPSLPEQQKLVDEYNMIQNRIGVLTSENTKLEEFVFLGYLKLLKNNTNFKETTIGKFGEFQRGKNITAEEMIFGEFDVISAGIYPSGKHNTFNVKGPSITVSGSGVNAGYVSFHMDNIWASDCSYNNNCSHIIFLYMDLKNKKREIDNLQTGSAQPHVYPSDINNFKIKIPESVDSFEISAKKIFNKINFNKNEISKLERLSDLVLCRLASNVH